MNRQAIGAWRSFPGKTAGAAMTSPGTSPGNDLGTGPRVRDPIPRWRRVFAGRDDQVREVRRWLTGLLPGVPQRDDVVVVAVELVTNAIRHTASGRGGLVMVEVIWCGPVLRVAVADGGAPDGPRLAAGCAVPAEAPDGAAGAAQGGLGPAELAPAELAECGRGRSAPGCAGIGGAGWCGPTWAGPAPGRRRRRCPHPRRGPAVTGRCPGRHEAGRGTRQAVATWSGPWRRRRRRRWCRPGPRCRPVPAPNPPANCRQVPRGRGRAPCAAHTGSPFRAAWTCCPARPGR